VFLRFGLRRRRTDVAEGPHFYSSFSSRRPSATPVQCGRRPTFLPEISRVGLRRRRSDVAEGPHFYSSFCFERAFGLDDLVWPKANIFSIRFVLRRPSASPGKCGRRPTFFQFVLFCVALRRRRADVAEGPHFLTGFFSRRPSASPGRCGRRPTILQNILSRVDLRLRRTDWPKANIFFNLLIFALAFEQIEKMWPNHVGLRPHRTLVGANHILTCRPSAASVARLQIIYSCRPSAASDAGPQIIYLCRPSAASGDGPQIIYL